MIVDGEFDPKLDIVVSLVAVRHIMACYFESSALGTDLLKISQINKSFDEANEFALQSGLHSHVCNSIRRFHTYTLDLVMDYVLCETETAFISDPWKWNRKTWGDILMLTLTRNGY